MAEFYEATNLFKYFCSICKEYSSCDNPSNCKKLRGLSDLPSINIIYCKDCHHFDEQCSAPEYDCPFWPDEKHLNPYGFCHLGERKGKYES